jgi:hypothetical protein
MRSPILPRRLQRGLGRAGRELRTGVAYAGHLPATRQLQVWRHGFYANHSLLYDFDRFGFDAYVSDVQRATRLGSLNESPQRELLDDKLATFLYLREVRTPTPLLFGFAHEGHPVLFDGAADGGGLRGLLEQQGRLIVKPRGGSGGVGVSLLEHRGEQVLMNGRAVEDVAATLGGRIVISEVVEQHRYAREVFAGATNTLRVLTLRDPRDGEPFVAFAIQRFGTERSKPVDNTSHGGVTAQVDLATGTLGRLASISGYNFAEPGPARWSDAHPDTGTVVTGTRVPHWDEIAEGVRALMGSMLGCHCIGWDVVVTPDGFSVIEGNNRPDVHQLQVHRPLLVDDRVRRFFAHHGVVERAPR